MANRYVNSIAIPQPIRKISQASTDFIHTLKLGERLDNLSQKFYNDPTLSWVIMCANPDWDNEFEIVVGTEIRIPYPLQRVFDNFHMNGDL